jgi:hypothetical protein
MMEWKLADAKNRFEEAVNRALTKGRPRRGDAGAVIAEEEFERMTGRGVSFKRFLLEGDSFTGLELTRDQSIFRDVSP